MSYTVVNISNVSKSNLNATRLISSQLDLNSRNMLCGIDDTNMFTVFENYELEEPAPRKVLEDRFIYKSRRIPYGVKSSPGSNVLPHITDLSEARIAKGKLPWQDIMPDVYRAPEIVLKMPWDNKVDIWSIGMMVRLYFHML